MEALETYLQDLRSIHYSEAGTDELSYYHPLLELLGPTLDASYRVVTGVVWERGRS
jgi:hypothetical protein